MPTPKLRSPAGLDGGDGGQDPNDDDKLHFIDDATVRRYVASSASLTDLDSDAPVLVHSHLHPPFTLEILYHLHNVD